jgi:hypothetical protein
VSTKRQRPPPKVAGVPAELNAHQLQLLQPRVLSPTADATQTHQQQQQQQQQGMLALPDGRLPCPATLALLQQQLSLRLPGAVLDKQWLAYAAVRRPPRANARLMHPCLQGGYLRSVKATVDCLVLVAERLQGSDSSSSSSNGNVPGLAEQPASKKKKKKKKKKKHAAMNAELQEAGKVQQKQSDAAAAGGSAACSWQQLLLQHAGPTAAAAAGVAATKARAAVRAITCPEARPQSRQGHETTQDATPAAKDKRQDHTASRLPPAAAAAAAESS